jgi:hypothetical protein
MKKNSSNFCIFIYVDKDERQFEASIPLEFQGRLRKAWGQSNNIKIIIMSGASKLSPAYIESLGALGYEVLNAEKYMGAVLERFPQIAKLSPYYSYTYLRWILAKSLIENGLLAFPYINIDADMVFLEDFEAISSDVQGKTFLLQGCPCFTPISDMEWLVNYEKELAQYFNNPEAYHRNALSMIESPIFDDRTYCNISAYKIPFRHEQDLQEYLIAAGKLPQASSDEVFNKSPFYWFQNPLFIGDWAGEQGTFGSTRKVSECGNKVSVNGKAIPFIHFQNTFAWYSHCWMRMQDLNLSIMKKALKGYSSDGSQNLPSRAIGGLLRRLDPHSKAYNRIDVYKRAFDKNPATGNMFITDILNSRW